MYIQRREEDIVAAESTSHFLIRFNEIKQLWRDHALSV